MKARINIKKRISKLIISIFLIALMGLFIQSACCQVTEQSSTNKHFLWSVKAKHNIVYLLGSIHFLKQDAYPLAQTMEDAYSKSQKIVFELDIDATEDPALASKMIKEAMYPEGQTLQENISKETYNAFKQKVKAIELPIENLSHFKPWFCSLMLTVSELQRLGFEPELSIEDYFYTKAKKDNKKLEFFEDANFQLRLFSKMDDSTQEAFLKNTLKELEVIEQYLSDMIDAWETGNADKLDSLLKISFKELPKLYDKLIVQRNKAWIPKIEKFLQEDGNVLIVVGSGHLTGKEGLIEMLKDKGYKISQQ